MRALCRRPCRATSVLAFWACSSTVRGYQIARFSRAALRSRRGPRLYLAMGDAIAMQYGGSEANKKVSPAEHADETRATAASDEASARSSRVVLPAGTGSASSAAHMRSRGGGISRLGGHSATEFLSSLQRYYVRGTHCHPRLPLPCTCGSVSCRPIRSQTRSSKQE